MKVTVRINAQDVQQTIAIKDYTWLSAEDNSTKRRVRYDEKSLLKDSLEMRDASGIIAHPELGHVYAMLK
jgi:hypothetical protein